MKKKEVGAGRSCVLCCWVEVRKGRRRQDARVECWVECWREAAVAGSHWAI